MSIAFEEAELSIILLNEDVITDSQTVTDPNPTNNEEPDEEP